MLTMGTCARFFILECKLLDCSVPKALQVGPAPPRADVDVLMEL